MATTINFPSVLAQVQDSQYFGIEYEDKGLKGEVDGGYVHTRPRHTRPPRKTFKTGFTMINQDQMNALEAFYELVGTYLKFNYVHPVKSTVHEVRFSKNFSAKYKGMGLTRLWNVTEIELVEA